MKQINLLKILSAILLFYSSLFYTYALALESTYVFASFAIPKAHLRQLLYDANQKKVPVVFRGLVNNSFQETLKKLHEIDPDHQTAFQVNPTLFKRYNINQVPTLIVDREDTKMHQHRIAKVVGDVKLARAIDFARTQKQLNKLTEHVIKNVKSYIPKSIKEPSNPVNTSFEESISEFSSVTHAGESMNRTAGNPKLMQMFIGTPEYCRITMLHYRNCCKTRGWGVDTHLASCRHNEKALAIKRNQHVCIAVGRYCAKKVLGKCTEYHQTFCCYSHPLAKLVQAQGRPQLHLNFGTPKHPNCSGFNPTQLQQLHFDQMDFRSYYPDVLKRTHLPDVNRLTNHIDKDLKDDYG